MKKLISSMLAIAMVLALFSGIVVFNTAAEGDGVWMQIPFINQYTAEQVQQMPKTGMYKWASSNPNRNPTNISITKRDDGKVILAGTTSVEAYYGSYSFCWTTGTLCQFETIVPIINNINIYGDAELSNKSGFAIKFGGNDAFWSAFTGANLCMNSSTIKAVPEIKNYTKNNDGYYLYDFSKTQWVNSANTLESIPASYDGILDSLFFMMKFNAPSVDVEFWIEEFYVIGSTDTVALHKAIREAKEAGFTGNVLTNAEEVYKNTESTQAQVDAAAQALNDKLDEIKFGYNKLKTDLDTLLTLAENLGFFDSDYARQEEISYADTVYTLAQKGEATADEIRNQIRIVRDCIAEDQMTGDVLAAFKLCNNAWIYNYTDASFKALTTAIDEAWALLLDDFASEAALAKLNAAYEALVPLPVRTNTANFFDGWTTAQVNDVVDANEYKDGDKPNKVDSIGNGLNTNNVWNAGDFTNNTVFEADNSISMTAQKAFVKGSMGWKNMDRSKTLQPDKDGAFPPLKVAGLAQSTGIRLKINVEGGNIQRLLIGFSNVSDMMKEDYALHVNPDCIDAEGYINIPFSYFVTSWWTESKGKFNAEDREKIIVFIIEAYGVDEGTTLTLSDCRGYIELEKASDEDVAKLAGAVAKLQAFDIAGRYADIVAAAGALDPLVNYSADYDAVYEQVFAVLKGYGDPDAAIVDVPGLSIFTQEEMNEIPFYDGGGCTMIKTERGMKHSLSNGSWCFVPAKFTYVDDDSSFGEHDCLFGPTEPINGKDLQAMFGGYTLNDIYGFSVMVENPASNADMNVSYKDGVGLWNGMLTASHYAYPDENGRYTWILDEAPLEGAGDGGWYGKDKITLERIKTTTKYLVCSFYKNVNKDIYGWQVILYKSVDRSALKEALTTFADLGLASYDDALNTYYDKNATEAQLNAAADQLVKDATPDAPSAPVLQKVTYNSVTLEPGAKNIEFRCGEDGEWTSLNVFEGLQPDTDYNFYARVMAIGVRPASEPSKPLAVRTLKAPLEGEITIEGEAVYGKTLTAAATITTENPGELTYVWSRATALEAVQVGTGTEYTIVKEDIGATLSVSVTAANLEGSLVSESTSEVAKAKPEIITPPANTVLMIGDKLGNANIAGAVVDVEGTWAWAEPELIPDLTQSGSEFDVIFTPTDTDCYEVVNAKVTVTVTSNTSEKVVTDADSGISLKGEFLAGSDPVMQVADINAAQSAYLALLRAARNSESANNLILFKVVSFSSQCYVGKLELSAQVSPSRAGQEYTVWFFANGEVCSSTAVVDAYGVITVSDFVADIA